VSLYFTRASRGYLRANHMARRGFKPSAPAPITASFACVRKIPLRCYALQRQLKMGSSTDPGGQVKLWLLKASPMWNHSFLWLEQLCRVRLALPYLYPSRCPPRLMLRTTASTSERDSFSVAVSTIIASVRVRLATLLSPAAFLHRAH
jgi:hypothetical protein